MGSVGTALVDARGKWLHFLLWIRLALVLSLLTGCSISRGYEAAMLLADITAGPNPTRLKSSTPAPVRSKVTVPLGTGTCTGDLYVCGSPKAGILLLPGAAEEGKDDPRVVAFAVSLARAGFAVLIPDLEGLRTLRVGSRDIRQTVQVFQWLVRQERLSPGGNAGMFSFSYASGPAMLAALDPEIAASVRFVVTVGGYYNLVNVLTFFTTGYFRDDGKWRYAEPNHYGEWVFVASNIERLSDPEDRRLFRLAAERKLKNPGASIADLSAGLGPEGQSLYAFLDNRDPSRAESLIKRLPGNILSEIAALDLAQHDLTRLKARCIIIHGYDDDIIPYTESIALAKGIGAKNTAVFLVRGLMHVDLKPRLIDMFRLWQALLVLLQQRDVQAGELPP